MTERRWLLAGYLLPVLPWLFGWGQSALARWQGDATRMVAGEYWRLLTASWVHLDGRHAAMNMAGLLLLYAVCPPSRRGGLLWLAGLTALAQPWVEVGPYAGASAVVYAWAAWYVQGWPHAGWRRLATAALWLKVAVQIWLDSRFAGYPVAHASHVLGLGLAGLLALAYRVAATPAVAGFSLVCWLPARRLRR